MGKVTALVRVADEVWIATALLHREHPEAADFSLQEIAARLEREGLTDIRRPGVHLHLSVHCVANRPPTTGTYRMLFETAPSRRRLFRQGDPYDPKRQGGKVVPDRTEIPPRFHALFDWYERESAPAAGADPLVELAARSRGLWKGVDADDYVHRLREGFE